MCRNCRSVPVGLLRRGTECNNGGALRDAASSKEEEPLTLTCQPMSGTASGTHGAQQGLNPLCYVSDPLPVRRDMMKRVPAPNLELQLCGPSTQRRGGEDGGRHDVAAERKTRTVAISGSVNVPRQAGGSIVSSSTQPRPTATVICSPRRQRAARQRELTLRCLYTASWSYVTSKRRRPVCSPSPTRSAYRTGPDSVRTMSSVAFA